MCILTYIFQNNRNQILRQNVSDDLVYMTNNSILFLAFNKTLAWLSSALVQLTRQQQFFITFKQLLEIQKRPSLNSTSTCQ